MAYAWTGDLETGNTDIDNQHKELFGIINNLMAACSKGQGFSQVQKTLDFLNDYIYLQFEKEEDYMKKFRYPDFSNHKRYHDSFRKTVLCMTAEYKRDGASITLMAKINSMIASWLINHIICEDARMAAHIRSQNI